MAVICYVLAPELVLTYLGPWILVKVLLPAGAASLAGHAVTIYACHANLASSAWVGDESSYSRLAVAIVVGMAMGVAYRNVFRALRWFVSGIGETDGALEKISGGGGTARTPASLPLPRAPSFLVPLPGATSFAAAELTVKVLLPTAKFAKGMVYNEKRTLQAFVDLEQDAPGVATIVRLIATEGGDGGVKGYFRARREGEQLRIYVDRILPEPGW